MFEHYAVCVVSAPSGAGKTTLNRRLVAETDAVGISISHTTRAPRMSERDGVDYYFVTPSRFAEMIAAEAFLEHAQVHGKDYGTSKVEVQRLGAQGKIVLLEIDVQGWLQARPLLPKARSIFILPPSLEELWRRLEGRGSDSLAVRWLRFQNAYREIAQADEYQYLLVNADLEIAYDRHRALVLAGKQTEEERQEGCKLLADLKLEFHGASWLKRLRGELEGV